MTNIFQKAIRLIRDNQFVHVLIIFSVSTVIFHKAYINEGYPMWADNILPILNMESFNDLANSTYAEKNAGMVYNPIFVSFYFLINKIFNIVNFFIKDIKLLSFIWIFLPYLTLYLTMYYCYKIIFRKNSISILLTLFYIFSNLNFSWIIAGWNITTYSHAGSILFLTLLIRYVNFPSKKKLFVLAITGAVGFLNIAYFYSTVMVSILYVLFYILVNKIDYRNTLRKYWQLCFIPILLFVLNAYWILPVPIMGSTQDLKNDFVNIYSSKDLQPFNTWYFLTPLQPFNEYTQIFAVFNSGIYYIVFITLILVTFFNSLVKVEQDKYLKTLLLTYVIVFGLTLGKNFQFLWNLFKYLPGSFIIRSPQLKFFSPLFFIVTLLMGRLIYKYKNKYVVTLIFIIMTMGIYGFYKGDIFGYWDGIKMPKDYQDTIEMLNKKENQYETVMMFPKLNYLPKLAWTTHEVYSYFIIEQFTKNPFIIRLYGNARVPTPLRAAYDEYDEHTVTQIGNAGVKYVLLHKDLKDIKPKHRFSEDSNLIPIIDGPNVTLYQVKPELVKNLFETDGRKTQFTRIEPYMFELKTQAGNLIFNREYDKNWVLINKSNLENTDFYNCRTYKFLKLYCNSIILAANVEHISSTEQESKNSWFLSESNDSIVFFLPQAYMSLGLIISSIGILIILLGAVTIILYTYARPTKDASDL